MLLDVCFVLGPCVSGIVFVFLKICSMFFFLQYLHFSLKKFFLTSSSGYPFSWVNFVNRYKSENLYLPSELADTLFGYKILGWNHSSSELRRHRFKISEHLVLYWSVTVRCQPPLLPPTPPTLVVTAPRILWKFTGQCSADAIFHPPQGTLSGLFYCEAVHLASVLEQHFQDFFSACPSPPLSDLFS